MEITAPQHFLNFFPLPQGHGSLRPACIAKVYWLTLSGTPFLHPESRLAVYLAVLLSVLQGISMRGAKILVSLSALAANATPFEVGVLAATFAVFPLLLAVYAGKVSDRIGVRRPIVAGAAVIAAGLALPLAIPGMAGLLAASALIGLGHIFFHVSIHNLIGGYGEGEARTRNFATFALGASIAAFFGPSLGGISIDFWGFRATHALLAAIALLPALILVALPWIVPPRPVQSKPEEGGGSLELLRDRGLLRTLVMSGVTLTGIELFTFYFPVYGRAVGLSASAIGLVMSCYAVAAFLVRMGMPRATRSLGEVGVLTASLFVAGVTYLLVPFVSQAPLLGLMAFLLGIGLGCAQPLTIILTYNHAPPGRSAPPSGCCRYSSPTAPSCSPGGSSPWRKARRGGTRMARAVLALSIALASLAAQAQAPAGDAARGKAAYLKNWCHTCHGTVGQGGDRGSGPRIAYDVMPYEAFAQMVRRPRQSMPRYDKQFLGDQELADIYAYVASQKRGPKASEIPLLKD